MKSLKRVVIVGVVECAGNSVRNRGCEKIYDLKLKASQLRDNQKESFINSTIDTANSIIETKTAQIFRDK